MTRKLVDSAQEVIVSEEDCGTTVGLKVEAIRNDQGQVIETLAERIQNRYSMEDVTFDGTTFVKAGEFISPEIAAQINAAGIETVEIRSVLHCNCKFGVCQKCYGTDLSTSKPIEIGSAVGVVAAQSIGEPVTQINMNTKHTGGVAGGTQIAQGYERIKQLFDVVPPKEFGTAIISPINGRVKSINDVIDDNEIKAKAVEITNEIDKIVLNINPNAQLLVKLGDEVTLGQKINQGSINLRNLLEVKDIETTRKYIIAEVQRVYRSQGIEINDKYIEVIVKQMTSKLRILNSGDSSLFIGQTIDINTLTRLNTELLSEGKQPITARPEILGLDEIPARAESFLAAASFQYTKRILINAAIRGQVDNLLTLKENIMLGSLIPAGTGLKDPTEMIEQGEKTFREEY
jgi:DNA-directed RNA polymerase subunit beta'